MKRITGALAGLLAGFCVQADVVLTEEVEYASAQTVSEKITGAGSIRKTGTGKLVLSNGANDFSGGVAISNGIVNGTVSGAFGSGMITVGAKGASVYFGATGASGTQVFANPITISGETAEGLTGVTGNTDGKWSVFFLSDTRLTGAITATRDFRIRVEPTATTPFTSAGPDATFDGAVDAAGRTLYVVSYGEMTFKGPITAEAVYFADQWSAGGKVYLASSGNDISAVYLGNERIICQATNVLGNGSFSWYATGGFEKERANVDLAGYNQRLRSISFVRSTNKDWDGARWNSGNRQCFKSTSPATLTLTGCDETVNGYATLRGAVSLLVDAPDHPTFVQRFLNAASTTTGSLTVSNGTLQVEGTASFPSVPVVTVGPNGTLVLATDNDAPCFAGLTTLTVDGVFDATAETVPPFEKIETLVLGAEAALYLPEGTVVFAKNVIVDGTAQPLGAYDASGFPQIRSGTVRCIGNEATAVTWTGGGADDALSNTLNWSSGMDVTETLAAPTFAAGGTRATVDADITFGNITFSAAEGTPGFTLARDAAAHRLYLTGNVTAETSSAAHRYEIDVPVHFVDDAVVFAATGQTNVFRNAFTAGSMPGKLTVAGPGCVSFEGTNVIDGAMRANTNIWKVSGLLGTPGHADQGEPTADGEQTVTILHSLSTYVHNKFCGILLDNAVIEKPLFIDNVISAAAFASRPGTTNEIKGKVRFSGQYGQPYGSWQPINHAKDSEIVFSGGAYFSHSFRPYGQGVTRFRDKPITAPFFAGLNPVSGKVVLEVTGNSFTNICLGYDNGWKGHCTLEMTVSGAMTNGNLLVGVNGGNPSAPAPAGMTHDYTVELNVTTQRCEKIALTRIGILNGGYPAMLDVTVGAFPGDHAGYCVKGQVTGGVGLRMSGPDDAVLLMTNRTFTSCGDLEVMSGTMTFAHDASWLNGTNVTVGGTGTLRLEQSKTFDGRFARLFLSGAGKISLPEGVSQAFSDVFVEGVSLGSGTYTAATLPDRILGAGTLRVVGRGTILLVR